MLAVGTRTSVFMTLTARCGPGVATSIDAHTHKRTVAFPAPNARMRPTRKKKTSIVAAETRTREPPGRVAPLTVGSESYRNVIQRVSARSLVVRLMAPDTRSSGANKGPPAGIRMALFTRNQGMPATQREHPPAVGVSRKPAPPTALIVTTFAARTQVFSVRVLVALSTQGAELVAQS